MHLKDFDQEYLNIDDEYFWKILFHIRTHVPEFASIWEEDDVYPIVYEFSEFILNRVENIELRKQVVSFIDEAVEQGRPPTEDLLVLQLFQPLYVNQEWKKFLEENLSNKAVFIFKKYFEAFKKDQGSK